MNNEFEEIINLSELLKDELLLLSDKFKKTGFELKFEDNQFVFIKNDKKIYLINLLKILEVG
ncbi:hypothetical protein [Cetobacterium sp.]|uniref:hypothetical protein n=1 Tax=Cetobacterium sp. TaxID=2071632 RepID=UPI003F3E9FF1